MRAVFFCLCGCSNWFCSTARDPGGVDVCNYGSKSGDFVIASFGDAVGGLFVVFCDLVTVPFGFVLLTPMKWIRHVCLFLNPYS
jgi:hypothetical protein